MMLSDKRKKITAILLFASFFLSACANTSNEKQEDEPIKQIVDTHSDDGIDLIGLSMPSQYLERWNKDGKYLKSAFEELGYEVDLRFAGNMIDTQVDAIDEMIDSGVDVLVIGAVDGLSLTNVVERAYYAGIPVIAYDRLICNSEYVTAYVSFDNYKVGTLQGQYVVDALDLENAGNNTYNIEFTAGDSVDNNAKYFFNGAMDVLSPYIEKGTLNVPSGQMDFYTVSTSQWSTETAKTRFEILIGSYYSGSNKLDAVVCSNDSTALGVEQAIDNNYKKSGNVIITGQDCDEDNLEMLMSGKQSMDVYKNLTYEAYVTVNLVDSLYNGQKMSQELADGWKLGFECAYDTTTYDNGKIVVPSFLLQPVLITKENAVSELVDNYGTYTVSEDGSLKAAE